MKTTVVAASSHLPLICAERRKLRSFTPFYGKVKDAERPGPVHPSSSTHHVNIQFLVLHRKLSAQQSQARMEATSLDGFKTADSECHTDPCLSDTSNRSSSASTAVGPSRSPPQDLDQHQQTSRSRNKPPSPRTDMEQSGRVPERGSPYWRSMYQAHMSRVLRSGDVNNRGINIANFGSAKDFLSNATYRPNMFLDRFSDPPDLSYSGPESAFPYYRPKPTRVVFARPRPSSSDQLLQAPAPVSISHPWEGRAHRHVVVPRQQVQYIDRIQSLARHGIQTNPDGGITVYFCPDACCSALRDVVGLHIE